MRSRKSTKTLLLLGGVTWITLVTAGFLVLGREQFNPVPRGAETTNFPLDSGILLSVHKPTLLLFVHPHCPCTRATLHELDGMLVDTQNRLTTVVVFTLPKGVPSGWQFGYLWNLANAMPGVHVMLDPGGAEAQKFGVTGSGHALLYDAAGRLLFSGGVTQSRGHEGDNAGRDAIESLVLTGRANVNRTPVFGCTLL